ncbi:MAG: glycine cleavage system protein T, partial [Pseudomonadota bacterium]
MTDPSGDTPIKKTALNGLWRELGAKMTPFAGYELPVQFERGVLKEHLHVRARAGLFDVSHMGQAALEVRGAALGADEAHNAVARVLERLTPSELVKLKPGAMRYTVLLNEEGGVLDDLIVTRPAAPAAQGRLTMVVNGAVKESDFQLIEEMLGEHARLYVAERQSLLALQGPEAARVLARHAPEAASLNFMSASMAVLAGADVVISRCGYTGED